MYPVAKKLLGCALKTADLFYRIFNSALLAYFSHFLSNILCTFLDGIDKQKCNMRLILRHVCFIAQSEVEKSG